MTSEGSVHPANGSLVQSAMLQQNHRTSAPVASESSLVTVWVRTTDGSIVRRLDKHVLSLIPYIQQEVKKTKNGTTEDNPLVLPKQVRKDLLELIVSWAEYHSADGRSDKERKLYNQQFLDMDTRRVCELTAAADCLKMKGLVDITSRALAKQIEGRAPEEIRNNFKLPDDLSQEEKLEPVKNMVNDPRFRLLNKLNQRKKQAHQAASASGSQAETRTTGPAQDNRTIDELLQLIGATDDAKSTAGSGQTTSKPGKTNSKKKHKKKSSCGSGLGRERPGTEFAEIESEVQLDTLSSSHAMSAREIVGPGQEIRSQSKTNLLLAPEHELFPEDGFEDSEPDETVADFERRLQQQWDSRLQELVHGPASSEQVQLPSTSLIEERGS